MIKNTAEKSAFLSLADDKSLIGRDIRFEERHMILQGPIANIWVERNHLLRINVAWLAEPADKWDEAGPWSMFCAEPYTYSGADSSASAHQLDDGSIRLIVTMVWSANILPNETPRLVKPTT